MRRLLLTQIFVSLANMSDRQSIWARCWCEECHNIRTMDPRRSLFGPSAAITFIFYCQTSEHVDSLESASFAINAVRIGFLFRSLLDFHRGFRFKRHLTSTSRHSTVTMIIDTLESIQKDIGIALVICCVCLINCFNSRNGDTLRENVTRQDDKWSSIRGGTGRVEEKMISYDSRNLDQIVTFYEFLRSRFFRFYCAGLLQQSTTTRLMIYRVIYQLLSTDHNTEADSYSSDISVHFIFLFPITFRFFLRKISTPLRLNSAEN